MKNRQIQIELPQLINEASSYLGLKSEAILSTSKRKKVSEARAILAWLAINDMGYSTSEVAQVLNISRVSAGRSADRGQKVLLCRETTLSDTIERRFLDDAD